MPEYDLVVVDSPPSLGVLTVNALAAANEYLVVADPTRFALDGVRGVAETASVVRDYYNPELRLAGIVVNLVDATLESARRAGCVVGAGGPNGGAQESCRIQTDDDHPNGWISSERMITFRLARGSTSPIRCPSIFPRKANRMSARTTAATAPPGIAFRWIVLAIVCAGQFMVALDTTIVNVALPSIQSDLHMSTQNLAWVINAYVLVFGGFLLLGGRAADLFGRRRLFASGIALFTVASLLCGLATSDGMLFAFRALQGLGAAMLSPAVVSIIITTFTEGHDRAKALAAWSGVSAAATAFGVILGGVLTDALSWPWIFFVNVPVGVAVIILARSFIAESTVPGQDRGLDVPGALLITGGLTALVYAIVEAQGKSWGSTTTIGFGAAAIGLLLVFALVEQRRAMPLVNLAIFRLRTLSTANAAIALIMGANATFFFLMTLYMQEVLHYTALQTGFAFVPLSLGMMAGSVLAQRLIPRIGIKPQAVLGLALSVAGFLLYLRTPASSASYLVDLMLPMLISSFGLGNALVPATLLATSNVPEKDSGLASGLLNTFFQIGGALGLAILTTLAASRTSNVLSGSADAGTAQAHADALVAGFHLAYGLGAAFFVAAGVLVVTVVRKHDLVTVDDTDALANDMAAAEVVVDAAR